MQRYREQVHGEGQEGPSREVSLGSLRRDAGCGVHIISREPGGEMLRNSTLNLNLKAVGSSLGPATSQAHNLGRGTHICPSLSLPLYKREVHHLSDVPVYGQETEAQARSHLSWGGDSNLCSARPHPEPPLHRAGHFLPGLGPRVKVAI